MSLVGSGAMLTDGATLRFAASGGRRVGAAPWAGEPL
eukprot:CAMPEP_0185759188 /NCGR_PEP_ID=MMETSP1174-20130828/17896_1 /TAXON_ID=35687 /ORGANISM="Dictyocha speculum, Strain CCMP1381" /LENGTH=36 /DNA_ID= /DNA_START= /DNA_END= /DNA_ORIENTATION=